MKRRTTRCHRIGALALLALGPASGCREPGAAEAPSASESAPAVSSAEVATSASATPQASPNRAPEAEPPTLGLELPVDLPTVPVPAREGWWVLAPPRAWLEQASRHGLSVQPFRPFAAKMLQPHEPASRVQRLARQTEVVPNALIIGMPPDDEAEPGALVLTMASEAGAMRKAVVLEREANGQLRVLYLPFGVNTERPATSAVLQQGTFRVLSDPGEPGTTMACGEGADRRAFTLVQGSDRQAVLLGFAGKLEIQPKANCTPSPLQLELSPGDRVQVPVVGRFESASVLEVLPKRALVKVRYTFATKRQEGFAAFGDILMTNR